MHKLLNEDDLVHVTHSGCGYTGPGQLVSIAYGATWLVKVDIESHTTIITVKAQHIQKNATTGVSEKKKKK